jgi:hypothetical protein
MLMCFGEPVEEFGGGCGWMATLSFKKTPTTVKGGS